MEKEEVNSEIQPLDGNKNLKAPPICKLNPPSYENNFCPIENCPKLEPIFYYNAVNHLAAAIALEDCSLLGLGVRLFMDVSDTYEKYIFDTYEWKPLERNLFYTLRLNWGVFEDACLWTSEDFDSDRIKKSGEFFGDLVAIIASPSAVALAERHCATKWRMVPLTPGGAPAIPPKMKHLFEKCIDGRNEVDTKKYSGKDNPFVEILESKDISKDVFIDVDECLNSLWFQEEYIKICKNHQSSNNETNNTSNLLQSDPESKIRFTWLGDKDLLTKLCDKLAEGGYICKDDINTLMSAFQDINHSPFGEIENDQITWITDNWLLSIFIFHLSKQKKIYDNEKWKITTEWFVNKNGETFSPKQLAADVSKYESPEGEKLNDKRNKLESLLSIIH